VPEFLPFTGIRYPAADITAVSAPPYDVIEPEARAALAARDPHNSVRLILPDSYDGAAATLARWRADGVLVTDETPTFSLYRMDFTGDDGRPQRTTGVIGALGLAHEPGDVMPHERTLPKAKTDRLELLRATRANLDPIWGLSLATGLSTLLAQAHADLPGAPFATATDEDGFHHSLWRITDPDRITAISAAVAGARVVLADGHHRFETANNYRAERRAAGISDPGADAIMTLVVELAPGQLCVRAIHRLLSGVAAKGHGAGDLRAALAGPFRVDAAGPNVPEGVAALETAMRESGGLGLVDRQGLALLLPEPELETRMGAQPAELRDVDSARFDAGVLPAVPGVALAYRNDARAVAAQVEKGDADAAVLLRPVTVDTIRAAAAADLRMPEKTTFFAPKPRTGMVFRSLD
jgi:uncharacterized protein (DUF1015 family)